MLAVGCGGHDTAGRDSTAPSPASTDWVAHEPTAVPSDWVLCRVTGPRRPDRQSRAIDPEERTWVWADLSRPNPWTGPTVLVVDRVGDPEFYGPGYAHDGSEPTTIRGSRGHVGPYNTFQGVGAEGFGYTATFVVRPGRIVDVTVRGGTAADSIAMANRIDVSGPDPKLPSGALGANTGPLRRPGDPYPQPRVIGQLDYLVPLADPDVSGLTGDMTVMYGVEPPDYWETETFFAASHSTVEVDGKTALVKSWLSESGPFSVMWKPKEQTIVVIGGFLNDVTKDELLGVARSTRPIQAERFAALRREAANNSRVCRAGNPATRAG